MDELESRAWLALVWSAELLPAALDAQLQADSHMTHFEFMVLSTLQQAEGASLRTTELAAAVSATTPRLSRVIGKLSERGLVERRGDQADARVVQVRLTTSGRRELVRAMPAHIAQARELVIDRLDRDELRAIVEALEPLVERLDPHRDRFSA